MFKMRNAITSQETGLWSQSGDITGAGIGFFEPKIRIALVAAMFWNKKNPEGFLHLRELTNIEMCIMVRYNASS